MTGRLLSLNVGTARPDPARPGEHTGITKDSVPRAEVAAPGVAKGPSGVAGDFIGDAAHHGGELQAVYAYAAEDYAFWSGELGEAVPHGTFGENLTTTGLDPSHALIGERWTLGPVVLEVTGPRVPCATFAKRMGVRGWVKRFTAENRTGAYFRVLEPGTIEAGSPVEVDRPGGHTITVDRVFLALMGDLEAADACLAAGVLPEAVAQKVARKAARRRR